MFRRLQEHPKNETLQSYLGMMQHGNVFKVRQEVKNSFWLWHTAQANSDSAELDAETACPTGGTKHQACS